MEFRTISTNLTADPNSTGAVLALTAIAQGDDIANRQGNKIRAKHLSVRGHIQINGSATTSHGRMLIIRDNNGSTAQPAITDLFLDASTMRVGKNKLGDPQSNSRFTILWDYTYTIDAINKNQVFFKYSMELDHHIYFTDTAATDEGKGHLYLFTASNEATNDPVVSANCMIKFIDN